MARTKKIKIKSCGGCYIELPETELKLAILNINRINDDNGQYLRYLCETCQKDPFFRKHVVSFKTV